MLPGLSGLAIPVVVCRETWCRFQGVVRSFFGLLDGEGLGWLILYDLKLSATASYRQQRCGGCVQSVQTPSRREGVFSSEGSETLQISRIKGTSCSAGSHSANLRMPESSRLFLLLAFFGSDSFRLNSYNSVYQGTKIMGSFAGDS